MSREFWPNILGLSRFDSGMEGASDIKTKQGGSGADKLDSLSKLVNSYSRLIERDKQ